MKKFKIVNKKVFVLFMLVTLVLISGLSFLIFKIVEFKRNPVVIQWNSQQNITQEEIVRNNNVNTAPESKTQKPKVQQDQVIDHQVYTKYDNKQYAYSVSFPNDWYLNTDSSETKFEQINIAGKNVSAGGQTFWSNYKNINDYSPQQKPDDFHLLGLTIYEAMGMNVDELASTLGFDAESILKKSAFEGQGKSGTEFIAAGVDEKNPLVMIIFQNDKHFYVFNLGFINGNAEIAETMENITKTLIFD